MVLGVSGLLTAAAVGGVGLRVVSWYDRDPSEGYRCITAHEAGLLDALAEAWFPPGGVPALSGAQAGVSRFLDDLFALMDEPTPHLLRLLLHTLDDWSRLSHGAGFVDLDLDVRIADLKSWCGHDNHLVRGAIGGLGTFIATAYTGHPEVKAACGWQFPCGYER
jgi:hypothetical protein